MRSPLGLDHRPWEGLLRRMPGMQAGNDMLSSAQCFSALSKCLTLFWSVMLQPTSSGINRSNCPHHKPNTFLSFPGFGRIYVFPGARVALQAPGRFQAELQHIPPGNC